MLYKKILCVLLLISLTGCNRWKPLNKPVNGRIVGWSHRNKLQLLDGDKVKLLGKYRDPVWHPDGEKFIAFKDFEGFATKLVLFDKDGHKIKTIKIPYIIKGFDWINGEDKIVFIGGEIDQKMTDIVCPDGDGYIYMYKNIYIYDLDAEIAQLIFTFNEKRKASAFLMGLSASPNGQYIMFSNSSTQDPYNDFFVIDRAGNVIYYLNAYQKMKTSSTAWYPDSNTILCKMLRYVPYKHKDGNVSSTHKFYHVRIDVSTGEIKEMPELDTQDTAFMQLSLFSEARITPDGKYYYCGDTTVPEYMMVRHLQGENIGETFLLARGVASGSWYYDSDKDFVWAEEENMKNLGKKQKCK